MTFIKTHQFSSVTQSCPTLQPHGLQCARPPCLSPTPGVYSNSCPLSWSKHLILCRPFLLQPSIFPSIRVFSNESVLRIRWPNIGVSASASVLPVNIQDWFPGWTVWISLQIQLQGEVGSAEKKSLLQHHRSKTSILQHSAFFIVQLSYPYMTTGKKHSFDFDEPLLAK